MSHGREEWDWSLAKILGVAAGATIFFDGLKNEFKYTQKAWQFMFGEKSGPDAGTGEVGTGLNIDPPG